MLLAVDFGSARVGVAACDRERILAYPVETLPAGDGVPQRLARLASDYGAVGVVVGYPLALDGGAGPAAANVREQALAVARAVALPVWLVDERMTTAEAQKRLRQAGRTVKTSRKIVDRQAAVGILEAVLNAWNRGSWIGQALEMEETDG